MANLRRFFAPGPQGLGNHRSPLLSSSVYRMLRAVVPRTGWLATGENLFGTMQQQQQGTFSRLVEMAHGGRRGERGGLLTLKNSPVRETKCNRSMKRQGEGVTRSFGANAMHRVAANA